MNRVQNERRAIFVDDGAPDAVEYSNNYIWFDPSDPEDTAQAWRTAEGIYRARQIQARALTSAWSLRPPRLSPIRPL